MKQSLRRVVQGTAAIALAALTLSLTGCTNFFICDKSSCTGGSGGNTAAGNVAYATNNAAGATTISGYSLGKSSLTAATNFPYTIGITPTAMVVSTKNGFLYVASALDSSGASGIFGFTIGSGGGLTPLNGGVALATSSATAFVAMDVSPDGNWLVATTAYDSVTGNGSSIAAYQVSPSTGLISGSPTPLPYRSTAGTSPAISALKVAPSGAFIAVAMGTGGVYIFPFASGVISAGAIIVPSTGGAFDVAIDSNNLLYVAATGTINVYAIPSNGIPTTATPVSTKSIGANAPFSVALDGTSYVYASGSTDGTNYAIYGFSIGTGGALTPTTTATISAPPTTRKLAVDSTGAYLLALGYDASQGLRLYSITAATGALSSLDSVATGTTDGTPAAALALTH